MTDPELAALIKTTLISVAPDIEGEEFAAGVPFREQFEIDSMDFLNFVIALHKATGIAIPERDYSKLATIDDCVAYLRANGFNGTTKPERQRH